MTHAQPSQRLVHESETQRQHVRVRVPGVLEIEHAGTRARFRLHDLSAGGIGFDARKLPFRPGERYEGRLHLKLDPLDLAIPVRFVVRHVDPQGGRVGGSFEELTPAEIASIRRVVTAYLSGELVGVDEVMHTLSRNNFTAPRGDTQAPPRRGLLGSLRAAVVTSLMMVVGAGALVYAGQRLQQKMFNTTASVARVSGPQFEVTMPRDGIFHSLVPDDGLVKKGAPIGSFETTMLDLVRSQAMNANIDAEELEALLGRAITGTITSPCDCRVEAMYAASEQYVGKGQPIASLAPTEFEPYVLARFQYPQANRLAVGAPVSVRVNGEVASRDGRVTQLRRGTGELDSDLLVVVQTDAPIPTTLLNRPVEVSTRNRALRHFESQLARAREAGTAVAHSELRQIAED